MKSDRSIEQDDPYTRSRARVSEAVVNILGTASDVAHELLEVSVHLLKFAPIAGLDDAARALLTIWDAVKLVGFNRLACLGLTERCATALMSIREEIAEAGDDVGDELEPPLARLVESFNEVRRFLDKQGHRSFLKRYLQREEIQRALVRCHSSVTDALSTFNTSIQIRIMKQVMATGQDMQAILASLQHRALEPPAEPTPMDGQVITQLQTVTAYQVELEAVSDAEELRQLMRRALKANSDVDMIRILQVGRDEMPEAIKALQRALEQVELETAEGTAVVGSAMVSSMIDPDSAQELNATSPPRVIRTESSDSARSRSSHASRDTLEREFIEAGIDAMQRLSGAEVTLPSWTITKYEVVRDEHIGLGGFSDVYKGKWKGQTVAIKELLRTTPRKLFLREVSIWKTLQHPNVLELFGASSASSDPPWFFVSPYLKNGSLVTYLKSLPSLDSVDLLKMIHEISKGMAYLHSKGVLHGDLKAANVLVNDKHHCVISDFGQSEMKSEAYRISGIPLTHGTLRWQAPELMSGLSGLKQEVDAYAFAITCVELLTKGALPWLMADDDAVRHFVLPLDQVTTRALNSRCSVWSQQFAEILRACWHSDLKLRPSFKTSPHPRTSELEHMKKRKSPDMHPIQLPLLPPDTSASFIEVGSAPSTDVSFMTGAKSYKQSHQGDRPDHERPQVCTRSSSRSSSSMLEFPRDGSEQPQNEHAQMLSDERRYRMLLRHPFDQTLRLPLWSPSKVDVGAVGYLHKCGGGGFITLFNAFVPTEGIPSLENAGHRSQCSTRRPSPIQNGSSIRIPWLSPRVNSGNTVKFEGQYSAELNANNRAAYLFTRSTNFRYIDPMNIDPVKKWFKANIDKILAIYGHEHNLSKENVYFVFGKLDAQDHALLVSHEHPHGRVDFNVFSATRVGEPWGEFSFSFDPKFSASKGLNYKEEPIEPQYTEKVSMMLGKDDCWESVLLARLRFKPDQADPTSR
ncbi:hypothetical protein L226DRAFT_572810 [Lentinus tigrinus ALCF2SS1-7]|uniref:Protein kinase domain-containing protein n=1 Tax=Lentinus tigrinus ALCF2SS1-6 TaxID=1328759 RepID=A0A5C2RS50_9APHY|nr:hypothetical protein L227DRAFT_617127 [Lentinus tigrinus ALCF2SS1-6]RPD72684.1 hypothetical protein L226DRAFT_572810 [Lentinus tigrinus ALCF2SS1-7]